MTHSVYMSNFHPRGCRDQKASSTPSGHVPGCQYLRHHQLTASRRAHTPRCSSSESRLLMYLATLPCEQLTYLLLSAEDKQAHQPARPLVRPRLSTAQQQVCQSITCTVFLPAANMFQWMQHQHMPPKCSTSYRALVLYPLTLLKFLFSSFGLRNHQVQSLSFLFSYNSNLFQFQFLFSNRNNTNPQCITAVLIGEQLVMTAVKKVNDTMTECNQ